jgi:hypothetical protein
MIKSRRMRWAGHVACTGRGMGYKEFWWGYLRERGHLEVSVVGQRLIIRWIFRKWVVVARVGSSWLGIGTGGERL